MSKSIEISKKHGINPTILFCAWCGKETGELGLVGRTSKLKCRTCGAIVYGKRTGKVYCPACGSEGRGRDLFDCVEMDVEVPKNMSCGLCDECKKRKEASDAEVKKGGIYWKCPVCGSKGALKAGSELAKMVRKKMKIKKPNPVGIEFTAEECPVCQKSIIKDS